jgi:hypothetical protein
MTAGWPRRTSRRPLVRGLLDPHGQFEPQSFSDAAGAEVEEDDGAAYLVSLQIG